MSNSAPAEFDWTGRDSPRPASGAYPAHVYPYPACWKKFAHSWALKERIMRPPPADPNLLAICFENLNHGVVRSNASQDVPRPAWGASRADTNKTPKTFSRSSGVGKPTNHQL